MRSWFIALATFAVASGACSKDERGIDGVGDYHLGKTQEKDVKHGRCTPQDNGLNWCAFNPRLRVAEQSADVHLYFDGHEPTAKLVEILLSINACKSRPIVLQFEHELGPAQEAVAGQLIWRGKYAVIVAQLDRPDGTCQVNFVSPSDSKRIAQLTEAEKP